MNKIYVTGHRNPDTDSIVAAMSYAALRNALGDRDYVAAHLGHISDETQRVLDRFGMEPPEQIHNMRTQVCDLDIDTPPALNATVTMDRAWHIMRDQGFSAIPVTREDGTLYGILSAGDIATYSMMTISEPLVEQLPLFNLLSVLEGRVVNDGGDMPNTVSGNVMVALPQSHSGLQRIDSDSIVLCGDQPDVIQRALDAEVSCLILCQTEVDQNLVNYTGPTCIITTPFDASRVVRLVYQATPVSRPCYQGEMVCFHLDDYIDDVREEVLKSRYRCYPVLDADERVVGTLS
ncbi:MAG: CBS domain-containing protein, partial [Ruminococcaceae bacterium]|nr:CBS domain-containing protein [Oscillospiraceae bacterium]